MKPRWWLTFPTRVKWKIEYLRLNPILVARGRHAGNYKCSYLRLSEHDVQFVRGEIFNVNVSFTVFYDSPQATTDLFVTVSKEVLRVAHTRTKHPVIDLTRPRHSKVSNPQATSNNDAVLPH